jgi:hypothetical protein
MASTEGMTVNNGLRKMWKEMAMAYFKQLSREVPGETGDNNRKLSVTAAMSWPAFERGTSPVQVGNATV